MRRKEFKTIGDYLNDFVTTPFFSAGLQTVKVFDAWDKVLTDKLFPYMQKEEVLNFTLNKFFKNGVLSCKISSSVVRSQMMMQKEMIISAINIILGEDVVKTIKLS